MQVHKHKVITEQHSKQQQGEVSVNADSAKMLSSYNTLKLFSTQKQVHLYRNGTINLKKKIHLGATWTLGERFYEITVEHGTSACGLESNMIG